MCEKTIVKIQPSLGTSQSPIVPKWTGIWFTWIHLWCSLYALGASVTVLQCYSVSFGEFQSKMSIMPYSLKWADHFKWVVHLKEHVRVHTKTHVTTYLLVYLLIVCLIVVTCLFIKYYLDNINKLMFIQLAYYNVNIKFCVNLFTTSNLFQSV